MPQGRPQRRYAPKTRSGCLTCKIRRIKCDEVKPACLRCRSTGRTCDGYSAPKSSSLEPAETPAINAALKIDVSSSTLERRTFDYFRSNTVWKLSGYFRDGVWDRLVLQASHTEPAVRYAVNALGALHEETVLRRRALHVKSSDSVSLQTNFPIKQYAKAMNEVQTLLNSPSPSLDVLLLCSMMFMHFEAINERFLSGLLHLENGIRLICSPTSPSGQTIDPEVVQTVLCTDLQASLYLGTRIPGLPVKSEVSKTQLPTSFRDLRHARDTVNASTSHLLLFLRTEVDHYRYHCPGSVPLEVLAKAQHLEEVSLQLERLLYKFMHRLENRLTIREQRGLDMLRTRTKTDRITASTCLYSEAAANDKYLDVFREILVLCEYTMQNNDFDEWLFSVSLDEGLVNPLWFVANNCRDSPLRHRALTLMKRLPSEGIWYLEAMIQITQACVRYEEALCEKDNPSCADIPEHRRIHGSGLGGWDITSPKHHATAHLRTRPNGMDGEWCDIQESIEFWNPGQKIKTGTAEIECSNTALTVPDMSTAMDSMDGDAKTFENCLERALHTEPWMARIALRPG